MAETVFSTCSGGVGVLRRIVIVGVGTRAPAVGEASSGVYGPIGPKNRGIQASRRPAALARQRKIDQRHGERAVASAECVTSVPDSGDQLAVTRRVGLTLWNRAVERPRFRHLQQSLRPTGVAGEERGPGGSQVLRGRGIVADGRRREGGRMLDRVSAAEMLLALSDRGSELPTPTS